MVTLCPPLLYTFCDRWLWSPFALYLLVDVGRMVSSATQVSDRLTAAVWDFPPTGIWRSDPQAVGPVRVVVAPTALELHTQRAKAEPASTATFFSLQPPTPNPGLYPPLQTLQLSRGFVCFIIISDFCVRSSPNGHLNIKFIHPSAAVTFVYCWDKL